MSIQDESYHDILRRNIGAALGAADWTNKRAAEAIGMNRNTFRYKQTGERDFYLDELMSLAQALNIPFSQLTKDFDKSTELNQPTDNQGASA